MREIVAALCNRWGGRGERGGQAEGGSSAIAVTIWREAEGDLCRPLPPPGLVYLINAWPPLHSFACRLHRRRYTELTVGYAESHDQALVGDQVRGGMWSPCPHSYATQDQAWLVPRVCRASRGILGSEFSPAGPGRRKGAGNGTGMGIGAQAESLQAGEILLW